MLSNCNMSGIRTMYFSYIFIDDRLRFYSNTKNDALTQVENNLLPTIGSNLINIEKIIWNCSDYYYLVIYCFIKYINET